MVEVEYTFSSLFTSRKQVFSRTWEFNWKEFRKLDNSYHEQIEIDKITSGIVDAPCDKRYDACDPYVALNEGFLDLYPSEVMKCSNDLFGKSIHCHRLCSTRFKSETSFDHENEFPTICQICVMVTTKRLLSSSYYCFCWKITYIYIYISSIVCIIWGDFSFMLRIWV